MTDDEYLDGLFAKTLKGGEKYQGIPISKDNNMKAQAMRVKQNMKRQSRMTESQRKRKARVKTVSQKIKLNMPFVLAIVVMLVYLVFSFGEGRQIEVFELLQLILLAGILGEFQRFNDREDNA